MLAVRDGNDHGKGNNGMGKISPGWERRISLGVPLMICLRPVLQWSGLMTPLEGYPNPTLLRPSENGIVSRQQDH